MKGIQAAQLQVTDSVASFSRSRAIAVHFAHRHLDVREHRHKCETIGRGVHEHSHVRLHCHVSGGRLEIAKNARLSDALGSAEDSVQPFKHLLIADHPLSCPSTHYPKGERSAHHVSHARILRRVSAALHSRHRRLSRLSGQRTARGTGEHRDHHQSEPHAHSANCVIVNLSKCFHCCSIRFAYRVSS